MGTERSRQLPGDAQFGDLPVSDGVLAAVAEARALGRRIRPADQPARPRPGLAGPTRRTIVCIRRSHNLARRRRPWRTEQEPWSRLRGFGPAFFTKFLYFSTPGALILDNRLANAVYSRSRLPYLVTGKGRSLAWTPYRYAVYLQWMGHTAQAVGVEPEILELTLFRPPGDLNAEHDAAD
jgi:hypothetical protein